MFEKTDSYGVVETYFDSISEWVSQITKEWEPLTSRPSFYNFYTTVPQAYKASLSCNIYSKRIEAISSQLTRMIQASMPDMQLGMDVTGLGFDTGLALSGVPECWLTQQPSKEPRVVKILVNLTASAGCTVEQLQMRGVIISALIKCLEVSGISSEVTLCSGGMPETRQDCRNGLRYFCKVKSSEDYFDLEKFSFAICDPGFYRRIGFSWVKTRAKNTISGLMGGMGMSMGETERNADMYIDATLSYNLMYMDLDKAKDWVIAKCREFGVEISNPPLV